jgi:hypothetical protein
LREVVDDHRREHAEERDAEPRDGPRAAITVAYFWAAFL